MPESELDKIALLSLRRIQADLREQGISCTYDQLLSCLRRIFARQERKEVETSAN